MVEASSLIGCAQTIGLSTSDPARFSPWRGSPLAETSSNYNVRSCQDNGYDLAQCQPR